MTYKPELAEIILERLADGESLRSICRDPSLPSKSEVFRWLADPANSAFRDQYARARETQADSLFDDILDIADEAQADAVAASKLRIDTRKWMAGKLRPKVYGDKLELSQNPENPWQPITIIERQIVTKGSE